MDNRGDRFGVGFIAGAIFGGVVGSLASILIVQKLSESGGESLALKGKKNATDTLNGNDESAMEDIRIELESKIAQINEAVDDLQQRLSSEQT
ncbi:hypothetical protein L3556_00740 [Candidatus Synechococcus calcipolaris G9]|uniref:Gas vesicle protein n=1 Tax=Candidatus Synechococcus calcipolaris G9 TaxID=1497997 RepID=A0ABT6EV92_9SYNE|nr:hypothetical protein [Candidatus Synechococcus calcipolaris]MDG2989464.1 hypothetical protein [Candidatus Synechococcus calcipolaris G9]